MTGLDKKITEIHALLLASFPKLLVTLNISATVEAIDFKFGAQLGVAVVQLGVAVAQLGVAVAWLGVAVAC